MEAVPTKKIERLRESAAELLKSSEESSVNELSEATSVSSEEENTEISALHKFGESEPVKEKKIKKMRPDSLNLKKVGIGRGSRPISR